MHCHQSLIAGELDILDFLFVFISVMLVQLTVTRRQRAKSKSGWVSGPPALPRLEFKHLDLTKPFICVALILACNHYLIHFDSAFMKLYKANKKQASLSLVLCMFGDRSFPLIIIQSCVIICTSLWWLLNLDTNTNPTQELYNVVLMKCDPLQSEHDMSSF